MMINSNNAQEVKDFIDKISEGSSHKMSRDDISKLITDNFLFSDRIEKEIMYLIISSAPKPPLTSYKTTECGMQLFMYPNIGLKILKNLFEAYIQYLLFVLNTSKEKTLESSQCFRKHANEIFDEIDKNIINGSLVEEIKQYSGAK